jgi:hypothetical protein
MTWETTKNNMKSFLKPHAGKNYVLKFVCEENIEENLKRYMNVYFGFCSREKFIIPVCTRGET